MKKLILLSMVVIATCALVSTAAACYAEPLTQGYWKTHSSNGPAPYDDTWACLGEDTKFLGSGESYFVVLTTPPKGGNAYYILAHQYIAAKLNKLNRARMPACAYDAYIDAESLLSKYTGMEIPKGSDRELAIEYATILEEFNSGQL